MLRSYRRQIFFALVLFSFAALAALIWLQMRGIIQIPPYLDLGILKIQLYSFTALAGILAALFCADYLRRDIPHLAKVDVWEAALYALLPGIIGARIYHVVTDWQLYAHDPISAVYLWQGGLGIIGGVMGGLLGLYVFCRRYGLKIDQIGAIAAVGLPLGQAIGRLGNMFNRELFGFPTDLPWGQYIAPQFNHYPQFAGISYFHPAFLYEALANLVLFLILFRLWKSGWQPKVGFSGWNLVICYLCGYGLIRFVMDFGRIEGHDYALGATAAQVLILIFFSAVAAFYLSKWLKLKHE